MIFSRFATRRNQTLGSSRTRFGVANNPLMFAMAKTVSPYRSLPTARRLELVTHFIKSSPQARELYVRRMASRPGGFRVVTLRSWSPDRLAAEVVRLNAQTATDELDLLHLLYVELDPSVQITFLDAAGVPHENGVMPDGLEAPYAEESAVARGAAAVREQHGEDGERYLRTLARYSPDAWPGIDRIAGS
jgi:hypothetical protein